MNKPKPFFTLEELVDSQVPCLEYSDFVKAIDKANTKVASLVQERDELKRELDFQKRRCELRDEAASGDMAQIDKLRTVLGFYAENDIHSFEFDWRDNGALARQILGLPPREPTEKSPFGELHNLLKNVQQEDAKPDEP